VRRTIRSFDGAARHGTAEQRALVYDVARLFDRRETIGLAAFARGLAALRERGLELYVNVNALARELDRQDARVRRRRAEDSGWTKVTGVALPTTAAPRRARARESSSPPSRRSSASSAGRDPPRSTTGRGADDEDDSEPHDLAARGAASRRGPGGGS
jgi:hypothetical protein